MLNQPKYHKCKIYLFINILNEKRQNCNDIVNDQEDGFMA